jgi:hypothetical protein
MFSAIDVYNNSEQNGRNYTPSLDDHGFQFFDIPPDCTCLSLDRLKVVNAQVGKFILDLKIRPVSIHVEQLQNTKALAYIMENIVMANNQLKQTAQKRVFKITREMWLEFLSFIEQSGGQATSYHNEHADDGPVYSVASNESEAFDDVQFVGNEYDNTSK